MSFGFSVGDMLQLIDLAKKTRRRAGSIQADIR
ncbi:hypothetical protein FOMA001_g12054 [Fusarium oxysporum f. sp. matthiolae]|nr:hypothetical protein FOMA001_g12054 [Fusarium oxysporum f. sp. matthiolae]